MKCPKSVKVGPYDLDVAFTDEDMDEDQVGAYQAREQRICILPDLPLVVEKHTLLHECIHAVFDLQGLPEILGEQEEFLASALEVPLLALLKENPDLLAYLTE